MISFKNEKFAKSVDECVNNSWDKSGPEANPAMDDNVHLREMLTKWNNYGSHLYPSVVIN